MHFVLFLLPHDPSLFWLKLKCQLFLYILFKKLFQNICFWKYRYFKFNCFVNFKHCPPRLIPSISTASLWNSWSPLLQLLLLHTQAIDPFLSVHMYMCFQMSNRDLIDCKRVSCRSLILPLSVHIDGLYTSPIGRALWDFLFHIDMSTGVTIM